MTYFVRIWGWMGIPDEVILGGTPGTPEEKYDFLRNESLKNVSRPWEVSGTFEFWVVFAAM